MPRDPWWKSAVIYQIYPRSFQDTNNDGVGDLRGIVQRLPYLVELGVDAIWISPIFPSPMADFGYDVSNYIDIDPLFGTLADFDALVAAAHACGIRVLLDFVPNHTSDRLPWFVESRSARGSPRRDWYLWRDPSPGGAVPNNWLSEFGGKAWELDPATGQYYYHAFLQQQPDLNWRNPQVREAMYDAMRFWLRRGVDGFRVDVLWHLIKDDRFRDNPVNPNFAPGMPPHRVLLPLYTTDRPEMEEVVAEMRSVVDEFDDRLLIGEIYLPIERLVKYYGRDLNGAHLPFNFSLLGARWHAATIAKLIAEYEAVLPPGGWPNWVLGNHDRPRIAGRVGRDQARIAAMLLLTLRGTPTIYYGDEIGMMQVAIPPDRVRDPFQKNVPGLAVGRDGCRTPMHWDDSGHAGFSQAEPWLPLGQDFQHMNVAHGRADPTSIYNLHRKLIGLRRSRPVLTSGVYRELPSGESSGDLLLFLREAQNERLLVALNFGATPAVASFANAGLTGDLLLSSHLDRERGNVRDMIHLRPNEGVVIRISVGNHSDLLRFEHQTTAERPPQYRGGPFRVKRASA
jgi:alpha-glucosidase